MQVVRYSTGVYSTQASFEERAKLSSGQAVTRPYIGRFTEQTYTRGSDMTIAAVTETAETLTVATASATPFSVDDLDALQSNYRSMEEYSKGAMAALNKAVDADYLAEVANATSYIDAGDVGGTAGQGISVDVTNVQSIFAAARRKLKLQNVDIVGMGDGRADVGNMKPMGGAGFADINPYVAEKLFLSQAGRESVGGDQIGKNGYMDKYFGFDCYETTNGYWTGTLALATQPTDGDTVTFNGVVFTFKTVLGSTAGNVLIGASAATANTNLAALINTPGTTTAQGVALSAANQALLKRISATAGATSTAFVAKGYGYVVVSETLTAAADVWTTTTQISHQLLGQKGAIDMVLAVAPKVSVSDIPLQLGKYVKPHVLYGVKTFLEGAKALVDVKVNSSSWV